MTGITCRLHIPIPGMPSHILNKYPHKKFRSQSHILCKIYIIITTIVYVVVADEYGLYNQTQNCRLECNDLTALGICASDNI